MDSQPLGGDARARPSRIPTFRAPTKASLARSNSEILERSHNRLSTTDENQGDQQKRPETKVFGLRDRKAFRPSLTSTASPIAALRQTGDARSPRSPLSNRRTSGLQAFAAPPRRVSRKITPADFTFGSPVILQKSATNTAPINTPDDQLASELGSATGEPSANNDLDQPSLNEELDEPDLPPTPTQLGLENPPERPTGLLSSSPSARRGRFRKRQASDILEQSPSKLRSVEYGSPEEEITELGVVMPKISLPEPVLKKQKLKRELSADLQKLKEDIAELESWSVNLNQQPESTEPADKALDKLISLLVAEDAVHKSSTKRPATDTSISSLLSTLLPFSTRAVPPKKQSPTPTNPFALEEAARARPYLSVFAPLTLTAHSNTISGSKNEILLERHHLTLSAPTPFPSNTYNISVIYETNVELQSLTSISVPEGLGSPAAKVPPPLRRWIDSRLSNPLLKLDISGLCHGINRYCEAMISRAFIWSRLEESHANLITGHGAVIDTSKQDGKSQARDRDPSNFSGTVTVSNLRRFLPHLKRSTMLFETKGARVSLLLSCDLSIDEWTSEPHLLPDISISAPSTNHNTSSKKIEQEAKKLFHAILKDSKHPQGKSEVDADVVIRATECVLGALFGIETEGQAPKKAY